MRNSFGQRRGLQQGLVSLGPLPTQIVSNEEFVPCPQTADQALVERAVAAMSEGAAPRLGVTRREFLKTSGGMAAALLAMNQLFGRFFDVQSAELFEPSAFAEQQGAPYFIVDVQTHYVGLHYDPSYAEDRRKGAVSKDGLMSLHRRTREAGLNPKLSADRGAIDDLSWQHSLQ